MERLRSAVMSAEAFRVQLVGQLSRDLDSLLVVGSLSLWCCCSFSHTEPSSHPRARCAVANHLLTVQTDHCLAAWWQPLVLPRGDCHRLHCCWRTVVLWLAALQVHAWRLHWLWLQCSCFGFNASRCCRAWLWVLLDNSNGSSLPGWPWQDLQGILYPCI